MKSLNLLAVSGLALSAFLIAAPAMAQQDNSFPAPSGDRVDANGMPTTHSTPTEAAQTDNLNQQADGAAQQSTMQGSNSDAQYQAQQQQYQNQVQQYQDQRQQYRADSENYSQNLRAYDLAKYDWYYPQAYTYRYGGESGLQPLYLIAEPSQQLAQVPVEGPGGTWVGRVRNVEIGPDGRPARVEIALNRRVSVWVHPGDLRLDPDEHILYTDLTRGELWGMPGATVVSGPS